VPSALLADKGYDADAIRADLAGRKIEAVIPGRSNRRVKIEHNRALYKQRNRIERTFGHLKINRAIATRYDQLANTFLGWSTSPRPDTGSNLSTPPRRRGQIHPCWMFGSSSYPRVLRADFRFDWIRLILAMLHLMSRTMIHRDVDPAPIMNPIIRMARCSGGMVPFSSSFTYPT
jgi:transposase